MNRTNGRTDQVSWRRPGSTGHRWGPGTGQRSSRRRCCAAAVVAAGLLVAGGLVVALVRAFDSPGSGPGGGQPTQTGIAWEAERVPGQGEPGRQDTSKAAAVELPAGTDVVEGYAVGFPRDELGAVAVPVELNVAQIGFDYDQASTAARVYAAIGDRDAVAARARDAVATRRRDLDLPATGPVAAPASFALSPYAFEATALTDRNSRYLVTVLSLASTTNAVGKVTTRYYTGTQLVAWASGDWKVVQPTRADQDQLAALLATSTPPKPVGPDDLSRLRRARWTPIANPLTQQVGTR